MTYTASTTENSHSVDTIPTTGRETANYSPVVHLQSEKQKSKPAQAVKWLFFLSLFAFGVFMILGGVHNNQPVPFSLMGLGCVLPVVWFALHERRDRKNPTTTMKRHWAVVWLLAAIMWGVGIFLTPGWPL